MGAVLLLPFAAGPKDVAESSPSAARATAGRRIAAIAAVTGAGGSSIARPIDGIKPRHGGVTTIVTGSAPTGNV